MISDAAGSFVQFGKWPVKVRQPVLKALVADQSLVGQRSLDGVGGGGRDWHEMSLDACGASSEVGRQLIEGRADEVRAAKIRVRAVPPNGRHWRFPLVKRVVSA